MICCDHKGDFFLLSVYNLSKDFTDQVKPGNSKIVVVDPVCVKTTFIHNNKTYEYKTIKVTDLTKLLLDGKCCAYYSSNSELTSTFFT